MYIVQKSFLTYVPCLILKARHLGGSAFCNFYRLGVPEQALDGILLGSGIVVEDNFHVTSDLTCDGTHNGTIVSLAGCVMLASMLYCTCMCLA